MRLERTYGCLSLWDASFLSYIHVCYCSIASECEFLTLPFSSVHHLSSLPCPALSSCRLLPCPQFSSWAPRPSYSSWILNCGWSLTSTTLCLSLSSSDSQWVFLPGFIYFSIYHQSFLDTFALTVLYLNGNFLFPEHTTYSSLAHGKNERCFRFTEVVERVGWSLSGNHGFWSFSEWKNDLLMLGSCAADCAKAFGNGGCIGCSVVKSTCYSFGGS